MCTAPKGMVFQPFRSYIDPFNKSNIYSFPLLTSLKLKVFNRISKAEYVINSGKLCILDLLKGSMGYQLILVILVSNRVWFFSL